MDPWAGLRLDFDIANDPPDVAALAAVRARASPRSLGRARLAGVVSGAATALALWFGVSWLLPMRVLLAVFAGAATAFPFLYWAKVAQVLADATRSLGRREIALLARWSARDEAMSHYLLKVARQGRALVYGDFAALATRASELEEKAMDRPGPAAPSPRSHRAP